MKFELFTVMGVTIPMLVNCTDQNPFLKLPAKPVRQTKSRVEVQTRTTASEPSSFTRTKVRPSESDDAAT